MRFVGISLAVAGLSSLLVSVVVANAVLGPAAHLEKQVPAVGAHAEIPANWVTTVTRN